MSFNGLNVPLPEIQISKFDSKRSFGLELEYGNKLSGHQIAEAIKRIDPKKEIKISQRYERDTDNDFWHVKLDHSCGDKAGDYGWEVASFKGSGIKDILLMGEVADSIAAAGANVNDRCALHGHVGIEDFSQAQVAVMMALWIKIEPYICHIIPTKRVENINIYAKFLRNEDWVKKEVELTPQYVWSKVKPRNNDNEGRRKSLNICNFVFTDRKTVEYRFPESTLSGKDVKNWLKLFILFVENSKNAEMPKDLSVFNFPSFLSCFGLYARNPFLSLSPGLRDVKMWLLNRFLSYSRSENLLAKTKEYLSLIKELEIPKEKVG